MSIKKWWRKMCGKKEPTDKHPIIIEDESVKVGAPEAKKTPTKKKSGS